MPTNTRSFILALKRFDRDARELGTKDLRSAASQLKTGVVERTPVRTGAAKRAWEDNKSPSTLELGDQYTLTNDVGYAVYLEYGTSQQAPTGMVRDTLTEISGKYGGDIEAS